MLAPVIAVFRARRDADLLDRLTADLLTLTPHQRQIVINRVTSEDDAYLFLTSAERGYLGELLRALDTQDDPWVQQTVHALHTALARVQEGQVPRKTVTLPLRSKGA